MLLIMWILLFILAILLMILSVAWERNPFWNLICIILDIPIWFILALSQMQLEIPYTFYTGTTVTTGAHTYTSSISPYLTYLFGLFGLIMIFYLIAMVWDKYGTYGGNY